MEMIYDSSLQHFIIKHPDHLGWVDIFPAAMLAMLLVP
jgi:hypothetical protein